jgi:NAD-dependent DNA ligase
MRTYILTTPKDANGQPVRMFKAARENNEAKAIDQLSGICEGILADGLVNAKEANFFAEWVRKHAGLEPVWPFTDILSRVEKIFADGRCTKEERQELKEIMEALCGHQPAKSSQETYSSTLPFNLPPPNPIEFSNHIFNITGKFAFGTRRKVMDAITGKGGVAIDSTPTHESNYLVVGVFASRDWIHTNYGRKIERAVELRDSGSGIAIISEEHWKQFLPC